MDNTEMIYAVLEEVRDLKGQIAELKELVQILCIHQNVRGQSLNRTFPQSDDALVHTPAFPYLPSEIPIRDRGQEEGKGKNLNSIKRMESITGQKERIKKRLNPVPVTYTELLPILLKNHLVERLPAKQLQPPFSEIHDPDAKCEFHSGMLGHSTDRCFMLGERVQALMEKGLLSFKGTTPLIGQEDQTQKRGKWPGWQQCIATLPRCGGSTTEKKGGNDPSLAVNWGIKDVEEGQTENYFHM